MNGDFRKKFQGANSVYILQATRRRRKYRPILYILFKPFLLNPPAQKVYITRYKAMTIANLVDIFCITELSLMSPNFKYIDVVKIHKI